MLSANWGSNWSKMASRLDSNLDSIHNPLIRFIGVQINWRSVPHLAGQTVDVMVVTDVQLIKQAFLIHLDCFRNDLCELPCVLGWLRQTTHHKTGWTHGARKKLQPTLPIQITSKSSPVGWYSALHGFKDGGTASWPNHWSDVITI